MPNREYIHNFTDYAKQNLLEKAGSLSIVNSAIQQAFETARKKGGSVTEAAVTKNINRILWIREHC